MGANSNRASNACQQVSRAQRIAKAVKTRQRGFYVVLERPSQLRNLGAILRTCDAFGVTQVLLINSAVNPNSKHKDMRSTSASANQWVDCISFQSLEECTAYLDSLPSRVISYATTVHSDRCNIVYDVDFCHSAADQVTARAAGSTGAATGAAGLDEKLSSGSGGVGGIALWFGNEAKGLTEEAQHCCPVHVFVPMLGVVESLNVSACVAIMCSEVARQRMVWQRAAQAAGGDWDWALSPEEYEAAVQRLLAKEGKGRRLANIDVVP